MKDRFKKEFGTSFEDFFEEEIAEAKTQTAESNKQGAVVTSQDTTIEEGHRLSDVEDDISDEKLLQ